MKIDMSIARDTLTVAMRRLDAVDGRVIPEAMKGRSRSGELSIVTKELLYLAHLLRRAEVDVLDEYHATKGFDDLDPTKDFNPNNTAN